MSTINEETTFNILLEEEEDEAGVEPKFRIQGVDLKSDGRLVNKQLAGGFHLVQCDMVQVCHGTTVPHGSPASLIVLLFAFQPFGIKKRFKWVEITLTLNKANGSTDMPEIDGFAPKDEFRVYPSEKTEEIGHELTAAVDVGFQVVKATPGYKWHHTKTLQKDNYARIVGKLLSKNKVKWAMYENPDTESGIPSLMQTAVLVKRARSPHDVLGEKFVVELAINGEVNRGVEAREKAKTLFGRDQKDKDQIFDLANARKGDIEDEFNLKLLRLENFQRLLTKQDWPEDGRADSQAIKLGESSQTTLTSKKTDQLLSESDAKLAHVGTSTSLMSGTTFGNVYKVRRESSSENPHSQMIPSAVQSQASQTKYGQASLENKGIQDKSVATMPSFVQLQSPQSESDPTTEVETSRGHRRIELSDRLKSIREEADLIRRLMRLINEERQILEDMAMMEHKNL